MASSPSVSVDSQASRKDELQAALDDGFFDAGDILLQDYARCCALGRCIWAGFDDKPHRTSYNRCRGCGFFPHKSCFKGFSPESAMVELREADGNHGIKGYCLNCLSTQSEVLVPDVGHFHDEDWPTLQRIFNRTLPPTQLFATKKGYEAAIHKKVGHQEEQEVDEDYNDSDEEKEDAMDVSVEQDSDESDEWEDIDEDEEEEELHLKDDSSSEEKKRYVIY